MTRREVYDGSVLLRPVPSVAHQGVVSNVLAALRQHCPRSLAVLPGPVEYRPLDNYSLQPDIVVSRRLHLGGVAITEPPMLLVEVIDEVSQIWDRFVKRDLYATSRVGHYWHVDPAVPEVVAYRLVDGEYEEVVTARGDERVAFEAPVLVELCPARLRFKA